MTLDTEQHAAFCSLGNLLDLSPVDKGSLLAAHARRPDQCVPGKLVRALEVPGRQHRRQRYVVYAALRWQACWDVHRLLLLFAASVFNRGGRSLLGDTHSQW